MERPVDITQLKLFGLDATVRDIHPLSGGANNRVYRLTLDDGSVRLLKSYFRDGFDRRDRLNTEYGAFEFLWTHGVRCIPQPLGCDEDHGFALYEFIRH